MKRGRPGGIANEHREILKAALDRDIKLACGLLEHHIWKGVEIVKDGTAAKLPNESNK
jgi:DNA-binding GntR family transcriptional regulator